jgi:hypothetical protein
MRSSPRQRHQHQESTCPRAYHARVRSGLGVSHPPAGFLLLAPHGFISPRRRSWGSTLQGFPLPRSHRTSSARSCPRGLFSRHVAPAMTRHPRALPTCAASIRTGASTGLQGFKPPGSPYSPSRRLNDPVADPLLGLLLPKAFPLPADGTDFAAPPPARFARAPLLELPPSPRNVCAPRYPSAGPVALPLTRPPCPFEVSRRRTTRSLNQRPVRAF